MSEEKTIANMNHKELYDLGYTPIQRTRILSWQKKYYYMSSDELIKREEQIVNKINELSDESEIVTEMLAVALRRERLVGK